MIAASEIVKRLIKKVTGFFKGWKINDEFKGIEIKELKPKEMPDGYRELKEMIEEDDEKTYIEWVENSNRFSMTSTQIDTLSESGSPDSKEQTGQTNRVAYKLFSLIHQLLRRFKNYGASKPRQENTYIRYKIFSDTYSEPGSSNSERYQSLSSESELLALIRNSPIPKGNKPSLSSSSNPRHSTEKSKRKRKR